MKIRKFLKIGVLLLSFFAAGAIGISALNKGANSAEAKLVKPIILDEGGGGYTDTTPKITFLAHGLGGYARDWSNDYSMFWSGNEKFAYDSSSLIEKMRTEYLNLNGEEMDLYVYSLRPTNTKGVPGAGLYKIGYGAGKTYTYTKIDTSIKNSFSSHSIVVMQYFSGCANFSKGLEGVCEEYKTGVPILTK